MFECTFAGALTIYPPVTSSFLSSIIIIDLLTLHLLNLIFTYTLPHDIGDRRSDQTEMDVNLDSAQKEEGKVSGGVSCCEVVNILQYMHTNLLFNNFLIEFIIHAKQPFFHKFHKNAFPPFS